MRLGDALSPDQKLARVRSSLVPGRILHLHCTFTAPPKNKFVVVVAVQPDPVLFVTNSQISTWLNARPDLRDRQVRILHGDHSYLNHDSFLNCTEAIPHMGMKEIEDQLLKDLGNIKDMITVREREAILYAVKECRTLTKKEIALIAAALRV